MTTRPGRRAVPSRTLGAALTVAAAALAPGCGTPVTVPATVPSTATVLAPPGIRTGPGTRTDYTVEAQPAPGSCHYRWESVHPLPDPACTPGATNPQVTQSDIATTVCRPGWTSTVRPPVGITGPEKAASALAYGYTGSFATAEYDHLVPLELGGDPNDPSNLWVEPNDNPDAASTRNAKDGLEGTLRGLVCSGSLQLATAQRAIATDWVAAARRYGG